MTIYMVMFDWSTTDDEAVEVQLFDTYEKAYKRFREIIADELVFDNSWAAEAFNEDRTVKDGFEFEEHILSDGTDEYDCWWNLTNKYDWNVHDFLDLKIMEVK